MEADNENDGEKKKKEEEKATINTITMENNKEILSRCCIELVDSVCFQRCMRCIDMNINAFAAKTHTRLDDDNDDDDNHKQ